MGHVPRFPRVGVEAGPRLHGMRVSCFWVTTEARVGAEPFLLERAQVQVQTNEQWGRLGPGAVGAVVSVSREPGGAGVSQGCRLVG